MFQGVSGTLLEIHRSKRCEFQGVGADTQNSTNQSRGWYEELQEIWTRKCMFGRLVSGALNVNDA